MLEFKSFELAAFGPANLFDITENVEKAVSETDITNGLVLVLAIGSTGAVLKLPRGSYDDFVNWVTKKIPYESFHRHPGNAFAHMRSSFIGCDLVLPIIDGKLSLEDQTVVLLENTAGRKRRRFSLILVGEC